MVDGEEMNLLVHRKGSTRAFAPGDPRIPKDYQEIGQPVSLFFFQITDGRADGRSDGQTLLQRCFVTPKNGFEILMNEPSCR